MKCDRQGKKPKPGAALMFPRLERMQSLVRIVSDDVGRISARRAQPVQPLGSS